MGFRQSTGIADLDGLLKGLIAGDNVVWSGEDEKTLTVLEAAFLGEGRDQGQWCFYATGTHDPELLGERLGPGVEILDGRPGSRFADPLRLERRVLQAAEESPGRVVFDGLVHMAHSLGRQRAVAIFSRLCPRLFDLGSLAYWRVSRSSLGHWLLNEVAKVTQLVLDIGDGHLRVIKAEGRCASAQGRLLRLEVNEDTLSLKNERALGRLGEGLRILRHQRNMTQGDLARLAGVSASAISQAESGHRGLSLDTLLTVSEALGVGMDTLLRNEPHSDYVVARRDRAGSSGASVPLLDDPRAGLRAYLIHLSPGERGVPPIQHKGVEMVLVATGLVQLDIGSATPVLRDGDAALATRVPVRGWRNLLGQSARLFWILRD